MKKKNPYSKLLATCMMLSLLSLVFAWRLHGRDWSIAIPTMPAVTEGTWSPAQLIAYLLFPRST